MSNPPTFQRPTRVLGRTTQAPQEQALLQDPLFQRLLDNRIVFIGSEIDEEVTRRVCAQLLLLSARDGERDIWMYINSPGGWVDGGLAVYDIMNYVRNDVRTVAMGMAASMGQFLLAAGTPGKRYALRHARIMMHQPSGGIGGTASDIKIQAEQSLYLKQLIAQLNARNTGQTEEQIESDSDRDRWFTADEARDYGFIDHVLESANELPAEGRVP
ncbi:MAG TPA: ATP-dependent Clp protease proteolytic subunit [Streptosporangiaceae bacterium]|jgi:ATP-dependent Clp protease protease subunit